jgi:hypothetical protein
VWLYHHGRQHNFKVTPTCAGLAAVAAPPGTQPPSRYIYFKLLNWVKIESTNGNLASTGNSNAKTATPTPGIPDPANANKTIKPGATPTPGIPDAANIKKQLEKNAGIANAVMNANRSAAPPMMMNKKKQAGPIGNRQP